MNKYIITILVLLVILAIIEVQEKPKEFTFVVATLDTPVPKLVQNDPIVSEVQAKPDPAPPKKPAPKPVVSKKETVAPPPSNPQRIYKK